MKGFDTCDVIRALLILADESQGGKTFEEMPTDALIPHSNGYSFWFISPGTARFGTAPLGVQEIADRVERHLGGVELAREAEPDANPKARSEDVAA